MYFPNIIYLFSSLLEIINIFSTPLKYFLTTESNIFIRVVVAILETVALLIVGVAFFIIFAGVFGAEGCTGSIHRLATNISGRRLNPVFGR